MLRVWRAFAISTPGNIALLHDREDIFLAIGSKGGGAKPAFDNDRYAPGAFGVRDPQLAMRETPYDRLGGQRRNRGWGEIPQPGVLAKERSIDCHGIPGYCRCILIADVPDRLERYGSSRHTAVLSVLPSFVGDIARHPNSIAPALCQATDIQPQHPGAGE